MQLSMRSQASLGVDKPAVSPSYVFGGQHVPVVVRLAESLWADGLAGTANTGRSLLNGTELLGRDQLSRALTLLHIDERGQCYLFFFAFEPPYQLKYFLILTSCEEPGSCLASPNDDGDGRGRVEDCVARADGGGSLRGWLYLRGGGGSSLCRGTSLLAPPHCHVADPLH